MVSKLTFLLFFWGFLPSAVADIYICEQDNGVPSAQDFPCGTSPFGAKPLDEPPARTNDGFVFNSDKVCAAYESDSDRADCYKELGSAKEGKPRSAENTSKGEPYYYSYVDLVCPDVIERLAKWDFEWTDGFLGLRFEPKPLKTDNPDVVAFYGDKLKMQNGFGAWSNVIYYCEVNNKTGRLVDVYVKKGKL